MTEKLCLCLLGEKRKAVIEEINYILVNMFSPTFESER